MKRKTPLLVAAVFAAVASIGVANAAVVGQQCGDKMIALTQAGIEQTADICEVGNSTGNNGGAGNSIENAGWIDSSEYNPDSGFTGSGPVTLSITQPNNWSLSNPSNYLVGISVKQGNGFAFYELNMALALLGQWFTGNAPSAPTGFDVSHINAWYKGEPGGGGGANPEPVPIPGGIVLLLTGLATLGGLSRIRKSTTAAA